MPFGFNENLTFFPSVQTTGTSSEVLICKGDDKDKALLKDLFDKLIKQIPDNVQIMSKNKKRKDKNKYLGKINDVSHVLETLHEKVEKANGVVDYVFGEARTLTKNSDILNNLETLREEVKDTDKTLDLDHVSSKLRKLIESGNNDVLQNEKTEILCSKLEHTVKSIKMIYDISDKIKEQIKSIIKSELETEISDETKQQIESIKSELETEISDKIKSIIKSELETKISDEIKKQTESELKTEFPNKTKEETESMKSEIEEKISERTKKQIELIKSEIEEEISDKTKKQIESIIKSKLETELPNETKKQTKLIIKPKLAAGILDETKGQIELIVKSELEKESTYETIEKQIESIKSKIEEDKFSKIYGCLENILQSTIDYNISKLQRAQNKFNESKELVKKSGNPKDFAYGKRNPKLAHALSLDGFLLLGDPEGTKPYKLETPFGPVWVKKSKNDNSRMIHSDETCKCAMKYTNMCGALDAYLAEHGADVTVDNIISPIIKYIRQGFPTDVKTNIFDKDNRQINVQHEFGHEHREESYKLRDMTTSEKAGAAAFLCGVLLLSESHELRNPTGGTFERKAMDCVERLVKGGCANPFSKVFGEEGWYLPARPMKMNNAKLIIEGKLGPGSAKGLMQNFIAQKYKQLIEDHKESLLKDPSDPNNKELNPQIFNNPKGPRTVDDPLGFKQRRGYDSMIRFIGELKASNYYNNNSELKKDVELIESFLKTLKKRFTKDHSLKPKNGEVGFSEPIEDMIKEDIRRTNKLFT